MTQESPNITRLRARVLYYFTASKDEAALVSWSALARLLELPEASASTLSPILQELPSTVDYRFTVEGVLLSLPGHSEPTRGKAKEPKALIAQRIFLHWREATGRGPRVRLTKGRQVRIMKRLGEGYSERELKLAADGVMLDPFYTGDNERSRAYTDIKHVYKDASTVERFAEIAQTHSPQKSHVQAKLKEATAEAVSRRRLGRRTRR